MIILLIIWFISGLICTIGLWPQLAQLTTGKLIIALLICNLGSLIFVINNILTDILNFILPEGWDDA